MEILGAILMFMGLTLISLAILLTVTLVLLKCFIDNLITGQELWLVMLMAFGMTLWFDYEANKEGFLI